MHRVHLTIEGRVQGVGFRWFVRTSAQALDVAGTVRNRPDGSVEVEAEGPRAALDRLVEALRAGPPGARVTRVNESWSEGPARHEGFQIGF
jgi:acylphosphatase